MLWSIQSPADGYATLIKKLDKKRSSSSSNNSSY